MKLNISLFANKDLLKIFGALLSVVIIMFASNYLVYKNSLSSIYMQVSENNKLTVQNTIRAFDESFKDINDLIYSIQMLPYQVWKSHDDGLVDLHEAYRMYKEIGELTTSIDYVEEVAIFHRNSSLAITRVGTIHMEELFNRQYTNKTYVAELWKTFAANQHPLRVFPAESFTKRGVDSKLSLLPVLGSNQLSDLNVLVYLNMDKLLKHIDQSGSVVKDASLIVLDQNRSAVFNTEAGWDLVEAMKALNLGTQSETTLKKKDFEYTLIKSDYNGFIYIVKSPYTLALMTTVANTNRLIIVIAIAYVLLSTVLLSYYLYKAVRSILALIGGREIGGTGYRNIKTGIVTMQQENETFKSQMAFIRMEMRKNAFLDILRESGPTAEADQRIEPYLVDIFQEKYFLLAGFHLYSAGANPMGDAGTTEVYTAVLQEELIKRVGKGVVFHMTNRRYLAVLSIRHPIDRESTLKRLRSLAQHGLGEQQEHALIVTASRLYAAQTSNVPIAYQELESGMTYRNLQQDDPLIDCLAIRLNGKVLVPLDEIDRAAHSLKAGNVDDCVRIVDEIVAANAKQRAHYQQMVPIMKTMFYAFVNQLDSGVVPTHEIVALEAEFNRSLEDAFHYGAMREGLVKAIRTIWDKIRLDHRGRLSPSDIARFIDTHYMEPLHLEQMAELMETSPKYFSTYFKKQFGVNFVEYLNRVRLKHAKELLRATDLTVAEIGEKTGFLTATTFTNTFRKYGGVSPSEYRKHLL
ncbi:helix-turn-helix transcriptional regulator [Paenibacillus koleovorans]|uniref:helix-turn-helix transcriptional regulator n=1 Tax=Paenibacillus koleovorans TaxID=121608 RepID=UPI000FD962E7|nr:AraC family transcriptional regulator [Paenibacillus koleovorans]